MRNARVPRRGIRTRTGAVVTSAFVTLDSRLAVRLRRVRLLALDFDGVLTDDRVLVGADGAEFVFCSRSDGMGIARLKASGVPVVILSSETHPVVAARAQKLGVPVEQGLADKAEALAKVAERYNVALYDVAFVGNDINDVECLKRVGLAAVPADARPEARACAHHVLGNEGGRGAVRELCEAILAAQRSVPEGWR